MKKFLFLIFVIFLLYGCKKEEPATETIPKLEEASPKKEEIDFSKIKAEIKISEGSIIGGSDVEFEKLERFDMKRLLRDFDFYLGKKKEPLIFIKGIIPDQITRIDSYITIHFYIRFENGKFLYEIQTYSNFDTAGSSSKGTIEEGKCSNYTDIIIKCKFYFTNSTQPYGSPPMSWVIVTIKDRALVNIEDDLGASFLGYIYTDKQYPEKYLANIKKALKVAVKDPEIGLDDEQIRGFKIEELDALTDGLASKVKKEKENQN